MNQTRNQLDNLDDDDELVNIRETDWWKKMDTAGTFVSGTRLKHQLTQKQLAKLAGMSHATISAYETGKKPLSRRSAIKLATAMGEDSDCFLKNVPGSK